MRSVFPAVSTDILAAQPKVPRTLQSDIHRYQRLSGTALLCTYIRWVRINNVILDGGSFISLPQHITLERASRYLFQVHPWLSHGAHVDPMLSHPSPATAHHILPINQMPYHTGVFYSLVLPLQTSIRYRWLKGNQLLIAWNNRSLIHVLVLTGSST